MKLAALVLALAGCGSVSMVADDAGAGVDATQVEIAPELPPPADATQVEIAPELRADVIEAAPEKPAPTCANSPTTPYCQSCRNDRGVCMCGALPCCDQHCQS